MRWPLVLLAATGCSQVFGLEAPTTAGHGDASTGPGDVGTDAFKDAAPDAVPATGCILKWMTGPTFSAVTGVSISSGGAIDYGPFVSTDGLEIEWSRDGEVFMATRSTTMQDFTNSNRINSLSSPSIEGKTWMSATKLRAFFASNRGSGNSYDIYRGSRNTPGQSFNTDQMYLDNVNTGGAEIDPHLSEDMLHMYLAITSNAAQHIAFTSRATINDQFAAPVVIPELVGTANDGGPTLTGDERVIVFTSSRGGNLDLYYATRPSASGMFGTPIALTSINSTTIDESPHLSPDGCKLYFSSDRTAANLDIFETAVVVP